MNDAPDAAAFDPLFTGGGQLGTVMAGHDWASTPVGPPSTWSPHLRNVVGILLTSRFSMWLGWGPELAFFYNDAYRRDTLQAKHPWALGRPAREVWAEIWHEIGPRIDSVLSTGVATWDENLQLVLQRSGYPEETYHTFSYSPLRETDGQVAGLLCVVTEDTDRVLAARRTATLRDLAAALTAERSVHGVTTAVATALAGNPLDVPFAVLVLDDETGTPVLAQTVGVSAEHPVADPAAWARDEVPVERAVVVDDLGDRFPYLPAGPWNRPARQAAVVAFGTSPDTPRGLLVVGLNPLRPWDDAYRGFVELAASQIAAALVGAHAFDTQRRRADELAALDRAKTTFFSNTSHEFRTPLTLMLGPLDELVRAPAIVADPALLQDVELVLRNGRRLGKLVNNLLEFSRIEAGRVEARFEPVDLATTTAELVSMFDTAITRAGLDLELRCPPLPGPVWVDPEMWEKVVLNLLSNAVKFTLEGSISVTLGPDPAGFAAGVVLEVADTGVGVPESELGRLFERFHQVHGARGRSAEGSGIGLALIKELVELHGGQVGVSSTEAAGTTFRVWLPTGSGHLPSEQVVDHNGPPGAAVRAEQAAPYVAEVLRWLPETPAPEPAVPELRRTHVLVVDDNADMRGYITRLLADDHRVTAVGDGIAALAAARADVPDLVVSDVMMPGLDGMALLSALRSDPATATVPVLLLSARAGQDAELDGLAGGADDYLVKPFSAVELRARVAARIERTRLRRDTERWFAGMADVVPTMIWVDGPGAKRILANAAWARFVGEDPPATEAHLGTEWQHRIHPDDRERYAAVRTAAESGRTPFEVEYRLRRDDGRYRWVLDRGAPFTLEDGSSGFVGGCLDIDDRQRDRERQRLLAVVGTVLDLATTLDHRRQLLVRTLVDEGVVDMARLIAFERPGDVTSGRPVAAAAATDAMEHLLELLDPWWFPDDPSIPERGRAGPFDDAMIVGRNADPRQRELRRQLRDLGLHNHSVVPLRTRGQTIGLLTGGRAGTTPAFDETDLALMTEIGERAATALDNVALLERERVTSRRLAVLQAATGDLSAAATPHDVAAVAITQFAALLDTEMVAVWELRGGSPVTLAVSGFPDEELWGRPGSRADPPLVVADVVRTGRRTWVSGRAEWAARHPDVAELVERCGVAAMGALPLRVGVRVVGAVVVGYRDEQHLDDDRASSAQALADQCGQALDRAGLLAAESLARRQAEEAGELVAALSLTDSPAQVAAVIAEAARAMGAVATAVVMVDDDGLRVLTPPGHRTDDGPSRMSVSAPHPLAEVVRTATALWSTHDASPAGTRAELPGQVAIPLALAGTVVGAFGMDFAGPIVPEPADRAALLVRAEQYAQALDRARLRETEHEVAEVLQRSLLPGSLPELDLVHSVARYRPGALNTQAGGDFYDVVEIDEQHVALVVGDIVGHGPRAAAVMGRLSAAATSYLLDGRSPAATLERVDRFAARQPEAVGSTCICVTLDRASGEIVWAGAGHPPLLLVEPDDAGFLENGSGVVLGVRGRRPYTQASRRIAPGSLLVAYTDGLVERRGEVIDTGLDRLRTVVESHRDLPVDEIADAVLDELVGENGPGDDVAFVVLRWLPAPVTTTLPAVPESLAELRRCVERWSTRSGLPSYQIAELQLAIGEAATNAVEHAYRERPATEPPGELELRLEQLRSRAVRATVRDTGRWRPPVTEPRAGGLGLVVIDHIADDVTVDVDEHGTRVSFLVPARPTRAR